MASFLTKFKQDFLENKAEHFYQIPGRDGDDHVTKRLPIKFCSSIFF